MPSSRLVTIESFIIEQERMFPEATGELTNLLYDVALAAKVISSYVRRAGPAAFQTVGCGAIDQLRYPRHEISGCASRRR